MNKRANGRSNVQGKNGFNMNKHKINNLTETNDEFCNIDNLINNTNNTNSGPT